MTDDDSTPFMFPPESELVEGVNEFECAPGLTARFGYCPRCRWVYPPHETHVCEVAP